MGTLYNSTLIAQQVGAPSLTITPEWAAVLTTVLIAILGGVLGQLKASWDMRSDLRLGLAKIEDIEKKISDHEMRLRDVERHKPS